MKKQVTLLLSVLILSFMLGERTFAQKSTTSTSTKAEEAKAMEKLKEAENSKARVEELYRAKMIDASTRRAEVNAIDEAVAMEFFDRGSGYAVAYPDGYIGVMSRSQNSETLEYRKSVMESSFTKELPFDVEDGTHKASIAVSGSCKEGEIRIKIVMPGGKTYTEVLLDEYGSVNWNKSFTLDEENDEKLGEWKFLINAKEATGNFSISIRSS